LMAAVYLVRVRDRDRVRGRGRGRVRVRSGSRVDEGTGAETCLRRVP
jgi:hypothetical protein